MLRRRQHRHRRGIDPEIDAALVERGDLVGGYETRAVLAIHHDSVEDVLLRSRDDVPDGANLLPVGRVHRHSALQHLVSDRQPLIHESGQ